MSLLSSFITFSRGVAQGSCVVSSSKEGSSRRTRERGHPMCQCHGAPCHQWGLFLFDGTKTYKLVVPQNEKYHKYCIHSDQIPFSLKYYQSVRF